MMTEACTPAAFTKPLRPPLLVFGGPYSNLRAVSALRAQATLLGINATRTICTGDIVAYCAEPEETVTAFREWGCRVVAGNCEEQLALGADDCGCGFAQDSTCNRLAKNWYIFARRHISAQSRAWMAGLPKSLAFTIVGCSVRVIHGGVDRINRFTFALQRKLIVEELKKVHADIVIAGHAGVPFIEKGGTASLVQPRGHRYARQRRTGPRCWPARSSPTMSDSSLVRRLRTPASPCIWLTGTAPRLWCELERALWFKPNAWRIRHEIGSTLSPT